MEETQQLGNVAYSRQIQHNYPKPQIQDDKYTGSFILKKQLTNHQLETETLGTAVYPPC